MKVNNKYILTPKFNTETQQWHCPNCNQIVDIYDDIKHYYYIECSCGESIANKNLMEERE